MEYGNAGESYLVKTINDKFHIQCPLWVLLWINEMYLLYL